MSKDESNGNMSLHPGYFSSYKTHGILSSWKNIHFGVLTCGLRRKKQKARVICIVCQHQEEEFGCYSQDSLKVTGGQKSSV